MAEVVHEVDVDEVSVGHRHGAGAGAHHGEQRDGEEGEVDHLLREGVDDGGDGLRHDGRVVVRVVPGVQVVVVQRAVEPVVEELHGPRVQQRRHHQALGVPPRQPLRRRRRRVHHVEEQRRQEDLVVPAPLPVHLLEVQALAHDPVLAPRRLMAGDADPHLAVEEAEEEHRQHGEAEQVPPLVIAAARRQEPVRAARRPWSHHRVLHRYARVM